MIPTDKITAPYKLIIYFENVLFIVQKFLYKAYLHAFHISSLIHVETFQLVWT